MAKLKRQDYQRGGVQTKKRIGGKAWDLAGGWTLKAEAERQATFERSRGLKARIVKISGGYLVYIR